MAEAIIPELIFGGVADAGFEAGAAALGELGAEATFAGSGIGAAADAAFVGSGLSLEGAAALGGGLDAAGTFAGGGDFLGGAGGADAGLTTLGTSGLAEAAPEAGIPTQEAGFGFEPAQTSSQLATQSPGSVAPGTATADLSAQGGVVGPTQSAELSQEAIGALNEPVFSGPDAAAAPSTELSSVADIGAPGEAATGVSEGPTAAVEPTAEELGGGPSLDQTAVEKAEVGNQVEPAVSKGAGEEIADTKTAAETAPAAAQQQQPSRGRSAGRSATGANAAGGFNPMALASSIFGLAKGQPSSPYLGQGAGYATNLGDQGNKLIDQYNTGSLTAGQLAKVQADLKNATAQINQFYSNAGRFNSTDRIKAIRDAGIKSIAQMQQFLDTALQQGLSALGQSSQALMQAANIQLRSDQQYTSSIMNALNSASRAFNFNAGAGSGSNTQVADSGGGVMDSGGFDAGANIGG